MFYLESLPEAARTSPVVVDKSMSTPWVMASILAVFPDATFINCRRHPMETAWSMYSLYFGDKRVPFANSFAGIAARALAYERLVRYWQQREPGRILDVRYEDLVNEPKTVASGILNFIGLGWHPACAEFHSSPSIVRTASVTQVRQPIYKTASQKWRRYEQHLQQLQELLDPLIEDYAPATSNGMTRGAVS